MHIFAPAKVRFDEVIRKSFGDVVRLRSDPLAAELPARQQMSRKRHVMISWSSLGYLQLLLATDMTRKRNADSLGLIAQSMDDPAPSLIISQSISTTSHSYLRCRHPFPAFISDQLADKFLLNVGNTRE